MSEKSNMIEKLRRSLDVRAAYIKAKLGILVPSQIRSLRLQSDMPRQADLAEAAGLHQSRISMFETPGAANMTLETLAKLAAAFEVGLVVKFVPMSEMLRWENDYSQDAFRVTRMDEDIEFKGPDSQVLQLADQPYLGLAATGNDWQQQYAAGDLRKSPVSAMDSQRDSLQLANGGR